MSRITVDSPGPATKRKVKAEPYYGKKGTVLVGGPNGSSHWEKLDYSDRKKPQKKTTRKRVVGK